MTRPLRLAVLLVGLLGACWALVSPLGSIPDEPAHVIQAAAVVRGQLGDGPKGQVVRVPGDVAASSVTTCSAFRPFVTADCAPALPDDTEQVETVSGAGRYPPLYYALVGWPTLFGFDTGVWYLMRLLSVALAVGLLWLAAGAWAGGTGRAVLPAGLLLAVSPMASFLVGSVNPNGVEIAAGTAFALATTGLLDRLSRGTVGLRAPLAVAVTGGYLALARPGSHLLLLALGAVLVVFGLPVLWRTARTRPVVVPVGVLLGTVLLAVAYARLTAVAPGAEVAAPVGLRAAVATVLDGAPDYLFETVGLFGWRDHQLPLPLQAAWIGLTVALLVAAWFCGRGHERVALLLLAVGAGVVAPVFVFVTLFRDGVGYQARYAMPLLQALPVLAAAVLARRSWAPGAPATRALATLPWVLLTVHLLALGGSWLRYSVGLPLGLQPLRPQDFQWVPAAWPLVLLLLAASVLVTVRLAAATGQDEASPVLRA